jgi:hypothetical protein
MRDWPEWARDLDALDWYYWHATGREMLRVELWWRRPVYAR